MKSRKERKQEEQRIIEELGLNAPKKVEEKQKCYFI